MGTNSRATSQLSANENCHDSGYSTHALPPISHMAQCEWSTKPKTNDETHTPDVRSSNWKTLKIQTPGPTLHGTHLGCGSRRAPFHPRTNFLGEACGSAPFQFLPAIFCGLGGAIGLRILQFPIHLQPASSLCVREAVGTGKGHDQ